MGGGKLNFIHPTAIVHKTVQLGSNNFIGPFCYLGENVVLGDFNRLEAYASVGTPPEHASYWTKKFGSVVIGNSCVIREFTTVNSGTDGDTRLGDRVILLRGSHVGHDSWIRSDVTLSCNVLVGGHSLIFDGANLGLGAILHQYSKIGHFAMLGMGCIVTKSSVIEPFRVYVGNPARYLKVNSVGLKRAHLTEEQKKSFELEFQQHVARSA